MASVKEALASMARNIESSTGKSVAAWQKLARSSGKLKHGEIVGWLKDKHGLGHGYANYIAKETLKADGSDDTDRLAAQFAGAKSALRPLYDEIVRLVGKFGADIEVAPKKNNVSLRRKKQFALLQPSTSSRLDVGLILKGVAATARLEASGSFNAMFTHRVRVEKKADIDAQLKKWLQAAYSDAE